MSIQILSLLTAFCSFFYQASLAQAVAGTQGGTLRVWALWLGLYTLSLGMGSLLADKVATRTPRKIFFIVETALVIVALFGLPWIQYFSETSVWLVWSPSVLIGLLSGFELPLLLRLAKTEKHKFRILAYDYFGMFVAALAFPLWILPSFGVQSSLHIAILSNLSLMAMALVMIPKDSIAHSEKGSYTETEKPSVRTFFVLACFAMGTATCGMIYELVLARVFLDFSSDEVTAHSCTVGFYLIGLGLGSTFANKVSSKTAWSSLFKTEIILAGLGALLPVFLYTFVGLGVSLDLINTMEGSQFWILGLTSLAMLVGFFSGLELPLLRYCLGSSQASWGLLLFFSYLGSLLGSLVVPSLAKLRVTALEISVLTAVANLGLAFLAIFFGKLRIMKSTWLLVLPALCIWVGAQHGPYMRWLYLSIDYLGLKLPTFNLESLHSLKESSKVLAKIDRIQTPYQAVDLVDTRGISNIVANSEGDFSVYLDRQPQFSISSERLYHESMVEGALHLAKNTPQKVVIFGGGDGLIARELLRHEEIKSIVLIELDSEILKISRENSVLSYLNEHSLDHPKVKLHVGDAFSFARKSEERFDAVFVDFPYPNNYELGRLYSLEFYQALKRILTPHGFAVLDAPLWRYIDKEISKNEVYPYQVIAKTLLTAGFAQPFFFGPVEPFVFLSNDGRSVAFDYQNLPHRISNRSFLNLSPIAHMRNENFLRSDIRVNSVLNPVPLWRLQ